MVLEFVAAAPPISYALHFEPRTKEKKKKQQQQQWEVTKQTQKCAAIVVIFGDCSCTRARAATLVCVFFVDFISCLRRTVAHETHTPAHCALLYTHRRRHTLWSLFFGGCVFMRWILAKNVRLFFRDMPSAAYFFAFHTISRNEYMHIILCASECLSAVHGGFHVAGLCVGFLGRQFRRIAQHKSDCVCVCEFVLQWMKITQK